MMDLREVQRLHAQFAPDAVTIDLPAQIAALPGTKGLGREEAAGAAERWAKAGPVFRRCVIAVVAATVVGSVGVGAAVLYKTYQSGHVLASAPASSSSDPQADARQEGVKTAPPPLAPLREIDAAEPRPVAASPELRQGDLTGSMPEGLTADQFRRNLGTRAPSPTQPPQAVVSTDEQRAMVSPIRRPDSARTAEPTASVVAATVAPTVLKAPAQPAAQTEQAVIVQAVPARTITTASATAASSVPLAQGKLTVAAEGAAPAPAASSQAKATHPHHHRVAKTRETRADQDASSSPEQSKTPPAPAKAEGTTEVKMF